MNSSKGTSIIIFSFTGTGTELNRRLCEKLKCNFQMERDADTCTGYAPEKYAGEGILPFPADKSALIGGRWGRSAYIFIGAAGIAVRYIAPWVKDKYTDSPVLVIDEKGQYVIPLLSGHVGGAAALADEVADMIGAVPVHTTATDVQGIFAVDVFARKNALVITDREAVKKISAGVLNGEKTALYIEDTSVRIAGTPPQEIVLCKSMEEAEQYPYQIVIAGSMERNVQDRESEAREQKRKQEQKQEQKLEQKQEQKCCTLLLLPRNIAAGIGCRKGIEEAVLEKGFLEILAANGVDIRQVRTIASINLKKNEPALLQLCGKYKIPFQTYTAEELGSVPGSMAASEFVKKITGVDNVCERAARLSCPGGSMIQGKSIREGMTTALVSCPVELIF